MSQRTYRTILENKMQVTKNKTPNLNVFITSCNVRFLRKNEKFQAVSTM